MSDFYHLGFVVQDINFSIEGPPFFEVIQGPVGSPWDATDGARFDHIGYWSHDVARDKDRLARRGAPVEFDASPYGRPLTYHRLGSLGIRLELVDMSLQNGFLEEWTSAGDAMPALELDGP